MTTFESRHASLKIRNDFKEIERAVHWLQALSGEFEFTEDQLFRLDLLINELLANIISYGYRDNTEHQIQMEIVAGEDKILLVVEDDGVAFNPLEQAPYREAGSLENARTNGRGIHLIRQFSDEQQYCRTQNNNRIQLFIIKSPEQGQLS